MDSTSTLQARLTPAARQKYPTYPAHIHETKLYNCGRTATSGNRHSLLRCAALEGHDSTLEQAASPELALPMFVEWVAGIMVQEIPHLDSLQQLVVAHIAPGWPA